MPTVEFLTKEEACARLKLKERRLRDYITAGAIRQSDEGLLHAGDVARLQHEREGKKANSQLRALATVAPNIIKPEMQLARVARKQPGNDDGNEATTALPDCAWLTLAEAERYTGLPSADIRHMIENSELPARRVSASRKGGRWRVKRADLDRIEGERVENL